MATGLRVRIQGREHHFDPREVRIGREPRENDLLSTNPLVSRCHARLHFSEGRWELEDLSSRHGVFANGIRVPRVVVDTTTTVWLGPPGRGQLIQLVPEGVEGPGSFAVFLSYRRGDAAGYAMLLSQRLGAHFGASSVFHDVSTLRPGTNYVDRIERSIGSCSSVVVLIGREWAGPLPEGRRRIDDPGDVLRQEIVAALELGVRVIPVLVQDAAIPPASSLPEQLRPLTRRHALKIDDTSVESGIDELIRALEQARDELSLSAGPGRHGSGRDHAPRRDEGRPGPPSPGGRTQTDDTGPLHGDGEQPTPGTQVPAAWWLLPVVLNVLGGLIAYAVLRDRDRRAARQMLVLGLVVLALVLAGVFLRYPGALG